jgi:hypothetical protein
MRWLAVDPGEMTGWSLWDDHKLIESGQTELVQFVDEVAEGLDVRARGIRYGCEAGAQGMFKGVQLLVVEEWKLYPWKANDLEFDEMRTSRGIGALEFIARQAGVRFVFQSAQIKEAALAAGAAELFIHPLYENRHQNDSIMHGWYFVLTELMGKKVDLPHGGTATVIDPDAFLSVTEDNK